MINAILLLGICVGILGEAFFAVSEISLVVSDKLAFLDRKEEQEPDITHLLRILSEPQKITHALLIGAVLSMGVSALFCTLLVLRLFPQLSGIGSLLVVLSVLLPLMTLLGEMIPRVLFYHRAEQTAIRVAKPLAKCMTVLGPMTDFSIRFYGTIQSLAGRKETEENPFVGEEDLEWIRCFAEESEMLRKEEVKIIRKIFDFSDIRVRDILVPMDHVVTVSEESLVARAMEQVLESGFTRLPVHRGVPERIVGLLHALDLLRVQTLDRKIMDYYRKPFFVNLDTLIRDLFRSMQKRGIMMAVVLDDKKAARGIVTMEDILEEIFGEIEDEYDLKDQLYRAIGEKEYLVDARIGVAKLNEQLQLSIPSNGYQTLSGYILHYLGRIPQEGERFTIGNLMFKIELADEKKIYKLFLKKLRPL